MFRPYPRLDGAQPANPSPVPPLGRGAARTVFWAARYVESGRESTNEGNGMTDSGKADQARKGLIDSVKGKAKEVVGAVTGNDSLTAEGQLEQTEAQQRKQASKAEAIADAEAREARAKAAEAKREGAAERSAVNAEA